MVRHLVNFVEKGVDHVVLDLELGEFGLVGLVLMVGSGDEGGDLFLEEVGDGLDATLALGELIVVTVDVGGGVRGPLRAGTDRLRVGVAICF